MNKKQGLLAIPYIIWSAAFIIIPLCMIVYYGFTDDEGCLTFENVAQIGINQNLKALGSAIILSVVSTVICLLIAYPLALILSEKYKNNSGIVVLVLMLPMWMNFLLRTIAWQTLLEKNGIINKLLVQSGLPTLEIINTPYAIVLGMVYNFLPFMILPIYNALIKIDPDIVFAASDLGATRLQSIVRIIVPLSMPGIISGITMVFVPALTTFVISDLLGGGKILLIGNVIEQKFKQSSNWHVGGGLSMVMMVFILLSMFVMKKYDEDGTNNTP